MPRVAGVDPGTASFDLCVLDDGEPVVEQVFETGSLSEDCGPLLAALARHGPYDLVYGPSGYGLPLVAAADVGVSRPSGRTSAMSLTNITGQFAVRADGRPRDA